MKKENQANRLKSWTIDEYYEKIKEFFSNDEEDKVIKIMSIGNWNMAYHYWIKPSLMPREKLVDIWWNYEPLMKQYFDSKEELSKNMTINYNKLHGFILRWLLRNRGGTIYQPGAIEGNIDNYIKSYKNCQDNEYMFGRRMDPFTYIGTLFTEKTYDGTEIISSNRPEYKDNNNYRVFYLEITKEEFLKEEKNYIDEEKHKIYKDDLIDFSENSLTKEAIDFFKINTKYNF